jgi:hypothetical protein
VYSAGSLLFFEHGAVPLVHFNIGIQPLALGVSIRWNFDLLDCVLARTPDLPLNSL